MGFFSKKPAQSGMKGFFGGGKHPIPAKPARQWDWNGLYDHLEAIFDSQFSGYRLARHMPVTVISPQSPGYSKYVDFLFCASNGRPLLAVLIVNNNNWKDREVTSTTQALENLGIPCMRFFEELPNEPSYIINRVRGALE